MQRTRPTMVSVYMEFAQLITQRSTCLERQVGCVITSADYENVYSIGYNGNAAGRDNECDGVGYKGSCGCVHAEQNALIKCNVKDKRKLMFCTLAPCTMCAKLMINSGFSKVFYHEDWKSAEGIRILRAAKIEVIKL